MAPPQIFISYRRDDTAGYARAIGDALGRQFGADRVFIDVDDIDAGQAFDAVIQQAVGGARVLLVLIGPRWLGPREGQPARIHDPGDLVGHEVGTALAQGLNVIPLLVDGAAMPDAALLPETLRPLTRRNALPVDNTRFAADMDRLLATLRPLLGESTAPVGDPPVGRRGVARWALAGALITGAAAAFWLMGPGMRPEPGVTHPSAGSAPGASGAGATARPAINGRWTAEVTYDWPNANYSERFEFSGEGQQLQGSASFLRVARTIEDGQASAAGLRFVTRSTEVLGAASRETEHRYQGTLVGDELRLTMQTVGGSSPHAPVQLVARRAAPLAASR